MTHAQVRQPLIGRESELAELQALAARAQDGDGGSVVISGEPGIGKTALIAAAAAAAQADGFTVIRCRGVESEAEIPYSALHQLLLPLASSIEELDPAERTALRTATALGDATPVSPLAASMATLTLLAQTSSTTPLIVVVDDLHWIDAATLTVVAFASRRIAHDRIALIVGTRPDPAAAQVEATRLDLAPLTSVSTGDLIARELGRALPEATAAALASATGGNALAAIETARYVGGDIERLGTMLDEPLPAGALIQRGFANRLVDVPLQTIDALRVLAATLSDAADVVHRALDGLSIPAAALDPAQDEGIIERGAGTIAFTHPVLRALVYQQSTAAARRAAHTALAAAETDRSTAAWHTASATGVADETVAAPLADVAHEFESRGGHAAAARALERAAQLTPDSSLRAQRFYEAALAARLAGRPRWTSDLLDSADEACSDSLLQLRIQLEHGFNDRHLGRVVAEREPQRVAAAAKAVDLDLAVDALCFAANQAVLNGRMELALQAVSEIAAHPEPGDRRLVAGCEHTRGFVLLLSGEDPQTGIRLLKDDHGRDSDPDFSDLFVVDALGWVEEYELTTPLTRRLEQLARARGAVHALISVLTIKGSRSFRSGDWSGAGIALNEGRSLLDGTSLPWMEGLLLAQYANLRAHQNASDAEALAAEVEAIADAHDFEVLRAYASTARAKFALGQRRGLGAVLHADSVGTWCKRARYREPGLFMWQADLAEGLILSGDAEAARVPLEDLRAVAKATLRPRALAAVARLDGLLAGNEQATGHFDVALAALASTQAPFDVARVRLDYGRALRTTGRRTEAVRLLEAAALEFEHLGAAAWLSQARSELQAAGAAAPDPADPAAAFTPQERAVAELVAQGLTNKQAAAQLFLTPKTIEWHLRQIYRKLDITSRTQLAAHLHAQHQAASGVQHT